MTLEHLADIINNTHSYFAKKALNAVNTYLTMRNWLIGLYIVEYEQNGEDRAGYGDGVLRELAKKLKPLRGMSESQLYLYRNFYSSYPQIFLTVSGKFDLKEIAGLEKLLTPSGTLPAFSTTELNVDREPDETAIAPEILIDRLSFSHFIELLKAESGIKREFYEVSCIKNNWSVRELKREMNTLLYERMGLSSKKENLSTMHRSEKPEAFSDVIKNPYLLEFLGLEEKPEYTERDLEQAILNHLQKFLVELGRGFCYEARQKRITFDNTHYYIDLVFYHRILKCHVLIDIKLGEFDHADAGQMNVYLNYYRENEMSEGDNAPVGIILCANKNNSLVKYALGGLSHEVFVAKYLIELPSEEELRKLIQKDASELIHD